MVDNELRFSKYKHTNILIQWQINPCQKRAPVFIGCFSFYQKTHCFLDTRQKIVNQIVRIMNHDSRAFRAIFEVFQSENYWIFRFTKSFEDFC